MPSAVVSPQVTNDIEKTRSHKPENIGTQGVQELFFCEL